MYTVVMEGEGWLGFRPKPRIKGQMATVSDAEGLLNSLRQSHHIQENPFDPDF